MEVILQLIILYGDVGAALVVLSGILYGLYKKIILPAWKDFLGKVAPFLAAVDTFHALAEKVTEASEILVDLRAQVFPNGGSSLRDAIDRIENETLLSQTIQRYVLIESGVASFETDDKGLWKSCNRELTKLVGRSEAELLGNGWIACLKDGTQQDLAEDYKETLSDAPVREWSTTATFVSNGGRQRRLKITTYPILDKKKKFRSYIGFIRSTSSTNEEHHNE